MRYTRSVPLFPWSPLAVLLWVAPAAAQQAPLPVRERQERQILLASSPDAPAPEVRIAAHGVTYLRFDAVLDRASVEIEGRAVRFRWLEVSERLISVEPAVDLGADEKLLVRARYKDGASPSSVTLVLVTHPLLVDKEVEVVRQARSREALEVALAQKEADFIALEARCARSGLPELVFSGLLGSTDILVTSFWSKAAPGYMGRLQPGEGVGYRARDWAMVAVWVSNPVGSPAWTPGAARLTSVRGIPVKVLSVQMEVPPLPPGGNAIVVLMLEPILFDEKLFQLELADLKGERLLPIIGVKL